MEGGGRVEVGRRRALALGAWATAVAAAGSIASRRGGSSEVSTSDPGNPTTTAPARAGQPPEIVSTGGGSSTTTGGAGSPGAAPVPSTTATTAAGGPDVAAPLVPLTGDALVHHVASRTTFGPTPALLDEIRTAGVDAWLDQQLRPWEIDDAAVEQAMATLPQLTATAKEHVRENRFGDPAVRDLRLAAVYRGVHSRRHLLEVMVDLWHDHLAASSAKHPTEVHLNTYDAQVIRPLALGRYADLLRAATRSGAMLDYLDTSTSAFPNVNENHGRELLELHTVGRDACTESDVRGAARVLSGWTLVDWDVVFDPNRHDAGPASVVGWSSPGRTGPEAAADLDAMLEHLAHHPGTARRVARALLVRFVADEPPQHLISSTADAYLASGTDIAATLRHVFASVEFLAGVPLVRRPLDLLVAQLRGVRAHIDLGGRRNLLRVDGPEEAAWALSWLLWLQRQPLFAPLNPAGHPLAGGQWLSGDALLQRWRTADVVVRGLGGVEVDLEALLPGQPMAADAVDALGPLLLGRPFTEATRAAAIAGLGPAGGQPLDDIAKAALVAFVLGCPELQVR